MKLRPYQQDALGALYEYLSTASGNPLVVIPTGGGKTPIIATICKDAADCQRRVLVLSHVKELVSQVADKLQIVAPELEFGIFCDGLDRKDTNKSVILASIQSAHNNPESIGRFDLVIIDEAHRVPENPNSMYRRLLTHLQSVNPELRICGFTATPYRLDCGYIFGKENSLFNTICYEAHVTQLIDQGYLCPLVQTEANAQLDLHDVHIRNGDFAMDEVENLALETQYLRTTCEEIAKRATNRKSLLVFSPGCLHAENVERELNRLNIGCRAVNHRTTPKERDKLVDDFREGRLRCLINVELFTIGFDAPNVDAIILLRPTMSAGLYYQMIGRGLRIHPSKRNCLILDFAGNIARHGSIENLRHRVHAELTGNKLAFHEERENSQDYSPPNWLCPECGYEIQSEQTPDRCPECDYSGILIGSTEAFRRRNSAIENHAIVPDVHSPVMGTDHRSEYIEAIVRRVEYHVHRKRGAPPDHPPSMRVDYYLENVPVYCVSEWVCIEHQGYPKTKAENWIEIRLVNHTFPFPRSVEEAVEIGREGGYYEPKTILIRRRPGERFWEIVQHYFSERSKIYDSI